MNDNKPQCSKKESGKKPIFKMITTKTFSPELKCALTDLLFYMIGQIEIRLNAFYLII